MNRIFILIGIINQLATTRINRILKLQDLPMAQFVLLQHFSHQPNREWTVTQLANALEVNQPAMTKTTQRLLKKGFLEMKVIATDKRIKQFSITDAGSSVLNSAWGKLGPEIGQLFSAWDPSDLSILQELLERLKVQLDEARD
jgi:DNA-binding MarR family transcriptional regulator